MTRVATLTNVESKPHTGSAGAATASTSWWTALTGHGSRTMTICSAAWSTALRTALAIASGATVYECCGSRFPDALGKYGCPDCCGDNIAQPIGFEMTPKQ